MKILLMLLLHPLAAHGTIVTTPADEDDGSLGSGTGISLREAVKYSPPGSIVTFAPALSGQTIRLGLGEILINQSLTIDGSALPSPIKVSGDKTGNGKTSDDTPVLRLTAGSLTLRSLILSDANCGESSGCITNFKKPNFKKPGFMKKSILYSSFLPLAFSHHEQPQAMDGALEGFADETCDLPLRQPGRGAAVRAGGR